LREKLAYPAEYLIMYWVTGPIFGKFSNWWTCGWRL